MGRRPTPTKLKELAGNPGKRPLNRAEPKPRRKRPRMPDHLSQPAQREWKRVTRELDGMGLLASADADAIAMYCDVYARWVEAVAKLNEEGMIVHTENGFPIQSPYLGIANRCMAQLQKLLIEFGMTPAARSRIHLPEEKGNDPFDDFLRQRAGG